ncbi:hypothetical protein B0H19DRAFT_1234797 [Mycena capillaripes]|nr:hypothetical protein B0H19DRAFT_1234797 [Mycena capillaripes]
MSLFTEFPADVLLEIAKQLDPAELLNFLSICRISRKLQLQRTLWLHALIRVREVHNLPLPLVQGTGSLYQLSLRQLQETLRHAHRLIDNFTSDHPRPLRVRTLDFNVVETWTTFVCIPGTNLAVSSNTSGMACWDIVTSECVAYLDMPDLHLSKEVPCMEIKGKALIGACIGMCVRNLVAINIDYADCLNISISHVISPATNDYLRESRFFVNPRTLGFCSNSSIITWCMDASIEVRDQPLGSPPPIAYARNYFPFGRRLYGFYNGDLSREAELQIFPFSPRFDALHRHPLSSTTTQLSIPYSFGSSQRELVGKIRSMSLGHAHVFPPDYGVFAVTLRAFVWQGRHRSVIHFWPGHTGNGQLDVGRAHFYEHTNRIRRIAVGISGTYVLILVYRGQNDEEKYLGKGDGYLGLVHFTPGPVPHTRFRKLDIGDVSPLYINEMALDESLGLVLFVDDLGKLTAISYA